MGNTRNANDCAELVNKLMLIHEGRANGVTWGPDNNECWAEFGDSRGSNLGFTHWVTCTFKGQLLRIQRDLEFYSYIR